jgi:hypothetical protein
MAEIYGAASVFGTLMQKEAIDYCSGGGRDQHLITASVRHYETGQNGFCVLPNDFDNQTASWNMGVNNLVKGQYKMDKENKALTRNAGNIVAILHQYDRHPKIANFLKHSLHEEAV